MKQRQCKECKVTMDIVDFAKAGEENGNIYYRHYCKKCYHNRKKPRREELRKWVIDYKKSCKCKDCGLQDFRVMEFHHIESKDFNISDGVNRGMSKIKLKKEIDKCEPLCANCHRIRHYIEKNEDVV